jgi:tetratricopeptide (TPR) repeat protein
VVCDSILSRRKKILHEKIGCAIEELYKGSIDEHYGVLAGHFIESEKYEKGGDYSKLAARKAQKAASYREAIEHGTNRVVCLERLPKTDVNQRKLIDARAILAAYYLSLNHHVEAKEAIAPIFDLAEDLNYQRRLPLIYTVIGTYSLYLEEDFPNGVRYLKQALKIAEKTGDFLSLWWACYFLGGAASWNCEFEKGIEYYNKALNLSVAADNITGISFSKGTMSVFNYINQGKIDLAYQTTEESLRLAEESGDTFFKAMAYAIHGATCYCKRLLDQAENNLLKGFGYCERAKQVAWWPYACFWLGQLYSERGEYERAMDYFKKAIAIVTERGGLWPFWSNLCKLLIVRSKVLNNDQDVVLGGLSKYYEDNKLKFAEGFFAGIIGEILLNIDDQHMPEAEGWIKKAIETHEQDGMMWYLATDYALYTELFKKKGDLEKAKENLSKAIGIFKECGADGWVKKHEEELASLP